MNNIGTNAVGEKKKEITKTLHGSKKGKEAWY